ncbi:MAG: transglycosylase domain-containing protein, partial [Dehalococcoidia bacterium]
MAGEGRINATLLLILPVVALPIIVVALVALGVSRFYDDTAARLKTPANMIAAVANYGGAQIFDRNGVLLYRFSETDGGLRLPARLEDVSHVMIDATVSTEDMNFWTHGGVDYRGTVLAAYENFRANGNPFEGRGGSGITQQLVKQTLIDPDERMEQSVTRKIEEAIYATEIASNYSREQILEWYLNVTNYGGVYNGVETAAQGYFGVSAADLTLAQAALLAGIPQSPALHSPYLNPEGARARQAQVLDLMVAHNYITQAEADEAKREPLPIQAQEEALPLRAPWFVEYVRNELIARYGEDCFKRCGLTVTTTLDITLQEQAQALLEENLAKHADPIGAHNGALLSIDARTGEIMVMVGSRNYGDARPEVQGSNNFATAILQPGSSFKPFVYMTLFQQQGYGPSSIIWDEVFTTSDGYKCENPGRPPRTYGPVPIKLALGSSLNCPANRAAAVAGVQNILNLAQTMGITTLGDASQYGPSIATGGANITLLDMAYAYTTLARNGSMVGSASLGNARPLDPVSLRRVTDATGRTLFSFEPETRQVIDPAYTSMVSSILSDCSQRRLIWNCQFPTFKLSDGRPVAAKTGTQQGTSTKEASANWLFMYTPNLVTGGWVGNANRVGWTDP